LVIFMACGRCNPTVSRGGDQVVDITAIVLRLRSLNEPHCPLVHVSLAGSIFGRAFSHCLHSRILRKSRVIVTSLDGDAAVCAHASERACYGKNK
jgi:hypothetical protein